MEKCNSKITRFELPINKVQELIANNGGTISLSTTPYAVELASMEPQYHKYHSPWGVPGDRLWVLENFRVEKLCQTADGYTITVKYEDDKEIQVPNLSPVAITAKNTMLPGASAPDYAIRLKLLIQDVQIVGEDWVFTMALYYPTTVE